MAATGPLPTNGAMVVSSYPCDTGSSAKAKRPQERLNRRIYLTGIECESSLYHVVCLEPCNRGPAFRPPFDKLVGVGPHFHS